MRLDKFIIGSPKDSPTHQFKNLKDVSIDFDQDHWVTVVIGWNGTGKSNVLEALAIIFRELIFAKKSPKVDFAFQLSYRMGNSENVRLIHIDHDPDRLTEKFQISVANSSKDGASDSRSVRLRSFLDDEKNVPRYVFSYYSGESSRMHDIFAPYLQWYDERLRRGEDPGPKRLFYALPIHSQFVLLAFLIGENNQVVDFLRDNLGLDPENGLESVMFVLRKPPWKSQPDGDSRFWGAKGIVRDFLSRLYEISLAPIQAERKVSVSLWNRETLQFKYLYVKDIDSLKKLVSDQTPVEFFRDLESTYVSQLIEQVRIKIKLRKNDGTVTFRELSEGEQQLLTVLGLLKFTAEEEGLFLLDEPDTHLNPRWSVDYLSYLKNTISSTTGGSATSHVLLTTHNPLAIAELVKEQVQVLQLREEDKVRKVVAFYPEVDPRGMGYAAIVASDMFGIASTLDQPTQLLLEKQRLLGGKMDLSEQELQELDKLNAELNKLGFRFFHPDDEYSRYLRLRNNILSKRFENQQIDSMAEQVINLDRNEREKLSQELLQILFSEESNPKQ